MPHVAGSQPLDVGARFPIFRWQTVRHGEIVVPDGFAGQWGTVVIYRGHW